MNVLNNRKHTSRSWRIARFDIAVNQKQLASQVHARVNRDTYQICGTKVSKHGTRCEYVQVPPYCMDSEPQLGGRSGQLERCTEQAGTSIVFTIRNTLLYLLVLSLILGNPFSSGINLAQGYGMYFCLDQKYSKRIKTAWISRWYQAYRVFIRQQQHLLKCSRYDSDSCTVCVQERSRPREGASHGTSHEEESHNHQEPKFNPKF